MNLDFTPPVYHLHTSDPDLWPHDLGNLISSSPKCIVSKYLCTFWFKSIPRFTNHQFSSSQGRRCVTFISDPMTLKISSAMPTQIMNICAANFIEIAPLSRGIASHEIGVKRRTDGRTADRRTYCLHLEFFDGGGRTNTQILLVFVFQLMLPGASIV